MPPDRVRAFPAPAIGAGTERLAGYIPPPPPPPSPPPCSGTSRSWCSGDEGQYGAPVWPVVLWAQPASASITKTAASGVRQFLTLFGPPDTGVTIQCHSIRLDEAAYLPPAIRSAGLTARETNYSITSSARARAGGFAGFSLARVRVGKKYDRARRDRYPKASDTSSPPCLLRLLPAGANRRVGLAPTGKAPPCHGARGKPTLGGRRIDAGAPIPDLHKRDNQPTSAARQRVAVTLRATRPGATRFPAQLYFSGLRNGPRGSRWRR
jgi:hypothetical protein